MGRGGGGIRGICSDSLNKLQQPTTAILNPSKYKNPILKTPSISFTTTIAITYAPCLGFLAPSPRPYQTPPHQTCSLGRRRWSSRRTEGGTVGGAPRRGCSLRSAACRAFLQEKTVFCIFKKILSPMDGQSKNAT
jgi:hypothetical protein